MPKIKHTRKFTLNDLQYVTEYVRTHYDANDCNCNKICEDISNKFYNLVPMKVSLLIHNGRMERNCHTVLALKDNHDNGVSLIIDPTGDQYDYENELKLKRQIAPWIYGRVTEDEYEGDAFWSINHMPLQTLENEEIIESDLDLYRITLSPFYRKLRCILI